MFFFFFFVLLSNFLIIVFNIYFFNIYTSPTFSLPYHFISPLLLQSFSLPYLFISPLHYKKRGYPSILKSVGIAPKSAGIGSKFLSRHFFSRCFRPPLFECGDRVVWTCTSAFQKRGDRSRRFQTLFRRF